MNDIPSRKIKTGSDPRTLPDYATLRDELSKLTHPARPDVDWINVERLCQALFRQNGVELQTVAYFTLARTHTAKLAGMEEGLDALAGLVTHHWPELWPPQVHARMDILAWLTTRLQQVLRTLVVHYTDLTVIYRVERLLGTLCDQLERLELKHLSQLDGVRQQMHNMARRLESLETDSVTSPISPPLQVSALSPMPGSSAQAPSVQEPLSPPTLIRLNSATAISKRPAWGSFVAGMLVMAALGSGAFLSWQWLRSNPAKDTLMATVAKLPDILTVQEAQALTVSHGETLAVLVPEMLPKLQQQLEALNVSPPLWVLNRGTQLVQQAEMLWPEDHEIQQLATIWRQQRLAQALPVERLDDWKLAQTRLQQLANKLNALDEPRGRYMTVSELKSAVFAIQQPLAAAVPLEELLRQYHAQQQSGLPPLALRQQIDGRFHQLLNRYALLVSADH